MSADSQRRIIGELQFHFLEFFDGTQDCFMSRTHKFYEVSRMAGTSGASTDPVILERLTNATLLYFTSALFHVLVKCNGGLKVLQDLENRLK